MSWTEIAGVAFGLVAVALTVRQSVWCWPVGLVQVVLFLEVFLEARLYSDFLLHVLYVGLQIYGWVTWVRGKRDREEMPVTLLSPRTRWIAAGSTLVGAAVWGEGMSRFTDAAAAHADAFVAAASICAQWLMARKKLESWLVWLVVDVVAIGVYWSRDLRLTAGLYVVFMVLCVLGLRAWKASMAGSEDQVPA